jgi:hypothetical protein
VIVKGDTVVDINEPNRGRATVVNVDDHGRYTIRYARTKTLLPIYKGQKSREVDDSFTVSNIPSSHLVRS